jgi:hypothetical protein
MVAVAIDPQDDRTAANLIAKIFSHEHRAKKAGLA